MLALLDPNGQIDQTATQAFIAGVSAQLGENFLQQTLQNDLHTDFVKQGGNFGIQQVGMIVAAVAFSMVAGPMFSAMVGNLAGATAGTATMMAAAGTTAEGVLIGAGLGNIALSAGLTAMTSSAFTQLAMNGSISLGSVLTSGVTSAITAGLLNGVTYTAGEGLGFTTLGGSSNSLSSLAGVNPSYVGGAASNAAATTADKLLTQGIAILGQSAIQAGVQSAIQGGSFLEALKTSGINNLGAALAFQIGEATVNGVFGDGFGKDLLSIGAHAALGCAGSAASGNGCADGAIGAAASAALTPDFIKAIDPTGAPLNVAQLAALSTLSSLMGGALSGLAGADPSAGAFWAQNEAANNGGKHAPEESVKINGLMGLLVSGWSVMAAYLDGRFSPSANLPEVYVFDEGNSDTKTPNVGEPGS
jgi:filamentous hemagglutinin